MIFKKSKELTHKSRLFFYGGNMLEKQKRKNTDRRYGHLPNSIEQLIDKYGLENTWLYIDKMVDYINSNDIIINQKFTDAETKVNEIEENLENVQGTADEAKQTADANNEKVLSIQKSVDKANEASSAAQEAANNAIINANIAKKASEEAKTISENSKSIAESAQEAANDATINANAAIETTSVIQGEITEAKEDISDIRTDLEEQIDTVTATMTADYAKKTDLSSVESSLTAEINASVAELSTTMEQDFSKKTDLINMKSDLQTQITQNAEQISSTAASLTEVNVIANDAKSKAESAQTSATAAQNTADIAKTNAQTAQEKANEANSAAIAAQNAADQATENLEIAQENLEAVQSQADATDEQVAAAKKAVSEAQSAANKAQSDATTAQTAAQNAQNTADIAKTNANNAQIAADNAKKAADQAQSDANALNIRVTANETAISQKADSVTVSAMQTYLEENVASKAELQVKADEITSEVNKKVGNDEIISKINQSAEGVSIKANKIALEGIITANENFKVLTDGSIEAKNGKFTGGSISLSSEAEGTASNTVLKIYDKDNPDDVYTYIYPRSISLEEDGNSLSIEARQDMMNINLMKYKTNQSNTNVYFSSDIGINTDDNVIRTILAYGHVGVSPELNSIESQVNETTSILTITTNGEGQTIIKAGEISLNNSEEGKAINITPSLLADSGWTTVHNISSDFNLYSNNENNRPRYRKIGKFVEIQGIVTPSRKFDANTQYTIFTLPEGYRPSRYQARICQGTGANVWLLGIETTGEVRMSRYRNSSSYGTANAGNWLPFNAVFSTD